MLESALSGQRVRMHKLAMSEHAGPAKLHVVAPGAGRNSLYSNAQIGPSLAVEDITATTLDSYADEADVEHITFVKIDAEGHDLAVIRGAKQLLASRRLSVIQFEYNYRWIDARCYLRDAFELLEPLDYRLGKLTPKGVEFYSAWDPELETFVEGNYVACVSSMADNLPAVAWRKPYPNEVEPCL